MKCGVDEKSFGGKSFYEVSSIHFKPREKDYDEDILEETTCLDDILIIKDYDELKEILLQTTDDDDSGDKSKGKKGRKSSKKDKDDDGDDDKSKGNDDGDSDGDGDANDNWEKGNRVVVEVDDESFPGKITSVDDDDETVSIKFDDGDTMDDVAFADLEPEPTKTDKKSSKKGKKEKGKKSSKDSSGKKCPAGGTFGKDTDQLKECADCPRWDKCDDAS